MYCADGLKSRERAVVVAHAAGGERGHGVHDGVEARHPRPGEAERAGERQHQIDRADGERDRLGPRHDLAQGIEVGVAQELHAADVEHRQEDHRQEDHPHSADPGHDAAPEQHAARQVVETDDHGGARRGHRRGELEIGVGETEVRRAQHQRQGGDGGKDRPGPGGEQEPLLEAEAAGAGAGAGGRNGGARDHGQHRREGEGLGVVVAVQEVEQQRRQHQRAQQQHEPADDVADGSDVDHDRRRSRALASPAALARTRPGVKATPAEGGLMPSEAGSAAGAVADGAVGAGAGADAPGLGVERVVDEQRSRAAACRRGR